MAAPNRFDGAAQDAKSVTPSNTTNFYTHCRGLYIGTSGDVSVQVPSGAVVFSAVPAGAVLPIECSRVNLTGTTALNIVAFF